MERIAFLVDATGERIDCLVNPETLVVRRLAGVRPAALPGAVVGGGVDDTLLFTGGGRTELVLDLLFDVDLVEPAHRPEGRPKPGTPDQMIGPYFVEGAEHRRRRQPSGVAGSAHLR